MQHFDGPVCGKQRAMRSFIIVLTLLAISCNATPSDEPQHTQPEQTSNTGWNHNAILKYGVAGGIGAGAVVFGTPLVLGALGWSAVGPVAGTFAATIQSSFGIGVVFATAQSIAMAGYSAAGFTVAAGTGAVSAIAGVYAVDTMKSQESPEHSEQDL